MPEFQINQVILKLRKLQQRSAVALVAIEGRGGAGKSTLARQLHDETGARVIAGDDFYRVMSETERRSLNDQEAYMQYVDWERLRTQVLEPLRNGKPARFERYHWHRNELGETMEFDAKGVIIVEGVYSFRPELRPFYDFSLFVDTPRNLSIERCRKRPHDREFWIQRWAEVEDWYFEHMNPAEAADMVISGQEGLAARHLA